MARRETIQRTESVPPAPGGAIKRGWRRVLGILRGKDGRTRMEEALRESEERARSIVDTAYDAFISIDALSVMTEWNRQAEVMFGWSREEAVGRRLSDTIIPPQLREAHERRLKHFLATGESRILNRRVQLTAVHRDGHEFPVELAVWAVSSGDSYTFNAFVQDITERKRAEEALRESEERFRSIFESSPIAMAIGNAQGTLVQVNRAVQQMLGYTEKEFGGMTFVDPTHPDDVEKSRALVGELLEGRRDYFHMEKRYHRKDGRLVWGHVTVSVFRDARGERRYIAMIQDITERKRMEEALQRAREELEGRVERQMLRRNPHGLTFRELTVLHLVAAGRSDKEIGIELAISPLTAQKHVSNILAKMDAASRTEAVARALREGLLD